jgi:ATP-dependent RNA helicase DDX10/DBP4
MVCTRGIGQVLEKLFRMKWTTEDGLGALIISPTRELALQIFEVLCTAGSNHQLSAGAPYPSPSS